MRTHIPSGKHRLVQALATSVALAAAILGASAPALAQTLVANNQVIRANGEYKIPDEVGAGTVTFTVVSGGGGGGGLFRQSVPIQRRSGGKGGNGIQVTATYANAGGKTFAITAGQGGGGQINGPYTCAQGGGDGGDSTVKLKGPGSNLAWAKGGGGGQGGCDNRDANDGLDSQCSAGYYTGTNCIRLSNGGAAGQPQANYAEPGSAGGGGYVQVSWTPVSATLSCNSPARINALESKIQLAAQFPDPDAWLTYTRDDNSSWRVCTITPQGELRTYAWGICNYTVKASRSRIYDDSSTSCSVPVAPDYQIGGRFTGGSMAKIYNNGSQITYQTDPEWRASIGPGNYRITVEATGRTCTVENASGTLSGAPP